MNPDISALWPVAGFFLGCLCAWLVMYSKARAFERITKVETQKFLARIKSLENSSELVKNLEHELKATQTAVAKVEFEQQETKKQLAEKDTELVETKKLLEEKQALVETLKEDNSRLSAWEKVSDDLNSEVDGLKNDCNKLQAQKDELVSQLENQKNENIQLSRELARASQKIDGLSEKTSQNKVFEERARNLEQKNLELQKEIERLQDIQEQLEQLKEIKQMYKQSINDNQDLKNEHLARHFVDIKAGLQQSIRAYNSVLTMVDSPALADSKIIEIGHDTTQDALQNQTDQEKTEDKDELDENQLDSFEPDTNDIEKLDGKGDE